MDTNAGEFASLPTNVPFTRKKNRVIRVPTVTSLRLLNNNRKLERCYRECLRTCRTLKEKIEN